MSANLTQIQKDKIAMDTVLKLTRAFEGIASMRIAKIKNEALAAQAFFEELWHIYTQVRADNLFRFGRSQTQQKIIDKDLLIAVTGESGLSGDIDQKLIEWMLKNYNPSKNDIIVIGHHGALQLIQSNVEFKKYFKLPERDQNINVMPVIKQVQNYRSTTAYYQTYVSLLVQDIKRLELSSAVTETGNKVQAAGEVISEKTYIFEPSTFAVVDHLERSMMQIMLGQIILESKLAQYASRFRAMSSASSLADDSLSSINLIYKRAKRAQKDERLKEIINGIRKVVL